jgi:hypothetical protein
MSALLAIFRWVAKRAILTLARGLLGACCVVVLRLRVVAFAALWGTEILAVWTAAAASKAIIALARRLLGTCCVVVL